MPTSVTDAFAAAGLTREGVVRWGTRPSTSAPGVYGVALTQSLDVIDGTLSRAPIADDVIDEWLEVRPELTLDGVRPTAEELKRRIEGFWLADETIVYVGLATSLAKRLGAYYRTPIGARSPHSGGYFLKLLSNLGQLWVHYAPCGELDLTESGMIRRFVDGVSDQSRQALHDAAHPFPFANLEWPRGTRKAHGLRGTREPKLGTVTSKRKPAAVRTAALAPRGTGGSDRTQRVTANDLRAGQIRIPSTGAAATKSFFPATKSVVDVVLRGRAASGSWDPRMGPDRERSGILRIGPGLRDLVREDEVLTVTSGADGLTIE